MHDDDGVRDLNCAFSFWAATPLAFVNDARLKDKRGESARVAMVRRAEYARLQGSKGIRVDGTSYSEQTEKEHGKYCVHRMHVEK